MARTKLDLDAFVPYRLSIASNTVSDAIATAYQALFGLRVPEWRIIAVLAEAPGLTQAGIGARTRMDKMTVSRAAAALLQRGLIRRSPNDRDRRAHHVELSDAGQALYRQIAPAAADMEERLLQDFDREEIERLMAMLRKLEARAAELGDDKADQRV